MGLRLHVWSIHLSWAPWASKLNVPSTWTLVSQWAWIWAQLLDSQSGPLSRGNNTRCPPPSPTGPTTPLPSRLQLPRPPTRRKRDDSTVCGPGNITDSLKKSTVHIRSDSATLTRLDFWTPLLFSLIWPRLSRLNSTSYNLLALSGFDRNDKADETTGDAARAESAAPRWAEDRLRVTGWSGILSPHRRVF